MHLFSIKCCCYYFGKGFALPIYYNLCFNFYLLCISFDVPSDKLINSALSFSYGIIVKPKGPQYAIIKKKEKKKF